MPVKRTKIPPKNMQAGSCGPHVLLLKQFLIRAGFGRKLVLDDNYDANMTAEVARYQKAQRLKECDGHFDSSTQAVAKRAGFDFAAACADVRGITTFNQPTGRAVNWSYRAPARKSATA